MKTIKIIFWTTTILFAVFMTFTAVPDVTLAKEAVDWMRKLGYPDYFTPFIGYAKILGSIAIVIPGFYRVKEWAYAGLFFDLIGATYSNVTVFGADGSLIFMALPTAIGIASYIYYHKLYGSQIKTA